MYLSKTRILAGLHCEKRLYFMLNCPELAKIKKSPLAESGIAVGRQARKEFSGGVLVNRFQEDSNPFSETDTYLNDENITAIFEAGFRYQDTEVFVDILQRDGSMWNLIEVKSSSSVKDEYIDDVTVQYTVLLNAGITINNIELMYLNKNFIYQGNENYDGLFIREDMSERVIHHTRFISDEIERLKQDMTKGEPVRHVDGRCKNPYNCEFKSYCEKQDGEYPVSWLPNAAVAIRKLHENGIYDIRDIPVNMLTSETHLKVRKVTIDGHAELESNAADILSKLDYPRYYLDFETINFAVPIWQGSKPSQQHPFQWSCHIQKKDDATKHKDFLDVSGKDPRRKFAESLIAACGTAGPVIVYNQSFEKGIIKSLAGTYEDLNDQLLAINARVFDLLPVMKKYYYHPDMKGSWSIKNVLTCLVPELRYSDLGDVQDGLMAQSAYLKIIEGKLSTKERDSLYADMLDYCKLDTYAMLAVIDKVCS
jgi:hypothetical protein